jgi:hypothetical protein
VTVAASIQALKGNKQVKPFMVHVGFWPTLMEFETRPELAIILTPVVRDFQSYIKTNDNGLWAWLAGDDGVVNRLLHELPSDAQVFTNDYVWENPRDTWGPLPGGLIGPRLDYLVLEALSNHPLPAGETLVNNIEKAVQAFAKMWGDERDVIVQAIKDKLDQFKDQVNGWLSDAENTVDDWGSAIEAEGKKDGLDPRKW